jgi:predicted RNA-binding protein with PIN domain
MPYLIDGHNLIPKIPGLSLAEVDDEQQLIALLQEFCRQQKKDAEVFFDKAPVGQARSQNYGRVKAHFVFQGTTADNAIRSRLRRLRDAANWVVVSSDREVQAAAKQARAQVISSNDFAMQIQNKRHLADNEDNNPHNANDDINEWLRLFGED